MSWLSVDDVAKATGGRWIVPPTPGTALDGVSIDTRDALEGCLFVALRGDRVDGHQFLDAARERGAAAAMVEQEVTSGDAPALPTLRVASCRAALTALATAWRSQFNGGVAAVTGSCGKTTTRRLLASILEEIAPVSQSPKSFNNDLGVPLTVLAARDKHRFLVCEIGMNAPGEIEPLVRIVRPHVAIITNIGRVHLEALGTIEAIAREKASVVAGLSAGGALVFPAESALAERAIGAALERYGAASHASAATIARMTFGEREGDVRLRSRRAQDLGSEIELDGPWGTLLTRLALPGHHNALNAAAAAAAATAFGASADAIRKGLSRVTPTEMRFVRQSIGPYMVSNDAYNANPEAMRASILTFAETEAAAPRRITVLGDMLELGPDSAALHRELGEWLASAFDGSPPDLSVFIGVRSADAARAFERARPGAAMLVLKDADPESARMLREALRPGDALLVKGSRVAALERLLPELGACASTATPAGGRR